LGTRPHAIAPGSHAREFILLLAAAAIARIVLLCLPFDTQFSLLADDAFYYLEAARRWVTTGAWPSMDGVHPTNGFHPLYMGLVGLVQWLIGFDPHAVVPVMLGLNLTFNALVVWVLARAWAGARTDPQPAPDLPLAALLLLAIDPGWIAHGLAGVENSLSSLLLLVFALRMRGGMERSAQAPPRWSPGQLCMDGLLAGACMLARSDSALWVVVGFGFQFARTRGTVGARRAVAELLLRVATAAAIVAPWLLANLQQFRAIAQDSALAIRARMLALDGPAGSAGWLKRSALDLAFWAYRLAWAWGFLPLTGALLGLMLPTDHLRRPVFDRVAVVVLPILCASTFLLRGNDFWSITSARGAAIEISLAAGGFLCGLGLARPRPEPASPFTRWIAASTGLTILLYAAWFGQFQPWYTTGPTVLGILLLTGPALIGLTRARPNLARTLVALTVLLLASRTWNYGAHGAFEGRLKDSLEQGAKLRADLRAIAGGSDVRFASFDSGRLSYVVHPFPVTNLDGVMNHSASIALRERRLGAYLADERIAFILSPPGRAAEFQRVSPFVVTEDTVLSEATGRSVLRVAAMVPGGATR
jgi:hypothetical protein